MVKDLEMSSDFGHIYFVIICMLYCKTVPIVKINKISTTCYFKFNIFKTEIFILIKSYGDKLLYRL